MNSMTYFTSDAFFTINNILISINRPNFTLVFFIAASYTGSEKNEQDQGHAFQDTYSKRY